jgi:acyl carrier protein
MHKKSQLAVYRSLRKVGLKREEITLDSDLSKDFLFDAQDWLCFLFLLESRTNTQFDDQQLSQVKTVNDVVRLVESRNN